MEAIRISEVVSPDLALRETANRFFNWLESRREKQITVDFKGVRSISRSFAHQYIERKRKSVKSVSEVNVPENVRKMFEIVQEPAAKPQIVDLRTLQVVPLSALPAHG